MSGCGALGSSRPRAEIGVVYPVGMREDGSLGHDFRAELCDSSDGGVVGLPGIQVDDRVGDKYR